MIFNKTSLGAISVSIQTGPFGSQLHQSDYSNEGVPVVMPKDLINGKISEESIARVSLDHVNRLSRHKIKNGDILYSRRGDVGKCAYATNKELGWLCGTGCLRVSIDPQKADSKFVFYCLQKTETIGWVINHAVGSTMLNLNTSILSDVPLELPSIQEQKSVVNILSAYDNLIENNQKQIKLLEEAAQRLYKEWFVALRFPGHENTKIVDGVPEGWRRVPLCEVIGYEIGGGWGEEQPTEKCDQPAYVIRGTDLYDVTHGSARSIPYRYHAQNNLASRKLQDRDIIFEVSGGSKNEGVARTALITQQLIDFLGENVICASFCKLVRAKNKSYSKFLYDSFQYLRNSGETVKFDKLSASSIVNYRWKDFLEQQEILIPAERVLKSYNTVAELIQKSIVNKASIIEQAKEARDRLLPKLMSGELEV